jgi:hypothetical protein
VFSKIPLSVGFFILPTPLIGHTLHKSWAVGLGTVLQRMYTMNSAFFLKRTALRLANNCRRAAESHTPFLNLRVQSPETTQHQYMFNFSSKRRGFAASAASSAMTSNKSDDVSGPMLEPSVASTGWVSLCDKSNIKSPI